MDPLVFESCNSTWIFDTEGMRFRRILKGIEVEDHPVATQWRPYAGIEYSDDSESFTVVLNEGGTRLLRSWRHTEACTQCGGQVTAELSLDEISSALA